MNSFRGSRPPGLLAFFSVLSLLLFATGCSSGLVQVQGEILLDEKPLPNAKILLMPETGGRPVTGTSDAQGKFQLTTSAPNDGALPGKYKVSVAANKVEHVAKPGSDEGFVEKITWIAPEHYSDVGKSGLTATIVAGQKELKLELKSLRNQAAS